ncbi:hypothetical protein [Nocardioides sp.]|uniref:hypothetical protein n=1 Tax=Nocardioides sp. TaxID=35761 RepID=UPI0035193DC8
MSPAPAVPRPPQVTLLAAMICGGSVLSVLLTFEAVSQLGSIETQEALARTLDRPPVEGLGLSVDQAQRIVRVLCFVTAGVAAAAAVLGQQLFKGSRQARVVLSVLAPVLFVAASFTTTSGFAEAVVAGATVLLWTQPSRDWFAGRVPAPRPGRPPSRAARAAAPVAPPADWAPPAPQSRAEVPTAPPAPSAPSDPWPAPTAPADPGVRPPAVLTAAVFTFLGAGTALIMLAAGAFGILQERTALLAEIEDRFPTPEDRAGASPEFLLGVVVAVMIGLALWALAVIPLAVAVLRGREWARLSLLISAYTAAAVSLTGVLAVAPVLVTGLCVAAGMTLGRAEVVAWCRASSTRIGPPPQASQPPPPSHLTPPS